MQEPTKVTGFLPVSSARTTGSSGKITSTATIMIGSKPTFITNGKLQFLITDAPRDSNLHLYVKECSKHRVTDMVRVCEPTYLVGELNSAGINLHEMPYPDGHSPPKDVLDRWLTLVDDIFFKNHTTDYRNHGANTSSLDSIEEKSNEVSNGNNGLGSSVKNNSKPVATNSVDESKVADEIDIKSLNILPTIAVHCVAGLGRAPVLVAIALIEFANMDAVEAVTLIRRYRRGAINEKQLSWLGQYKRNFRRTGDVNSCCAIS